MEGIFGGALDENAAPSPRPVPAAALASRPFQAAALASQLPRDVTVASQRDGTAVPDGRQQRPASQALEFLSDMLDLGTPRPPDTHVANKSELSRPTVVIESEDSTSKTKSLSKPTKHHVHGMPESQSDSTTHLTGNTQAPMVPWCVYSPVLSPDSPAKPPLDMSHRSVGYVANSKDRSLLWAIDECPSASKPAAQGGLGNGSTAPYHPALEKDLIAKDKQIKKLRDRISDLEQELAAAHFAVGQDSGTATRCGVLTVKKLSLWHLPPGKSDPVIEISIGKQKKRTNVVHGCLDTCSFEDDVLLFQFPCFDSTLDSGAFCQVLSTDQNQRERVIGCCLLDLSSVANCPGTDSQDVRSHLCKEECEGAKAIGNDSQESEVQMEVCWQSSLGDDEALHEVLKNASRASSHIMALEQVIEQSEVQVMNLQQIEKELSAERDCLQELLRAERQALQLCTKKLAAAEAALETDAGASDSVVHVLHEEKARFGSILAGMLTDLIDAKMQVRQIVGKEKTLQANCIHLELELANMRMRMRESFAGFNKENSELGDELNHTLAMNENLQARVADLSGQVEALKRGNLEPSVTHLGTPAGGDSEWQSQLQEINLLNQTLQQKIKQLDNEIISLKEHKVVLQHEHEVLQRAYTDAKRDLDAMRNVSQGSHVNNSISESTLSTPSSTMYLHVNECA